MKVLITGGQGDMAQAIAIELAERGNDVYFPSRDELDVTNEKQVKEKMGYHKPDILINCAGYIQPGTIIDSLSHEWKKHIEVNLIGTYLCTKYALMNGCSIIINIASSSSLKGRAKWSAYCASKVAVASFTESLAEEGVEAYCISPGRSKTKMRNRLFPMEDQGTLLEPRIIGRAVLDVLDGRYKPGTNIVIKRENISEAAY